MAIILLFIAVILSMMFPWIIPLFILLGIIIYFIKEAYKNSNYGKKQTIEKNKKIVKEAKALQERMNSCGVFPTYSVTNGISTIYFDENNRRVYLKYKDDAFPNSDLKEIGLNVDGIISYGTNINKDSNIQYTMGTYFTGKLKVNEDINSIWLSLQLNSIDTPYIYVLCSYSIGIPEANQFANKVIGALDYMKTNKVIAQKPLLKIVPDLETEIVADEKKTKESSMGLFKSKEEKLKEKMEKERIRQEKAVQPLIDKGIKISKIVDLPVMIHESEYRFFVIDTENKKWCYIDKIFNKDTKDFDKHIKIFDFCDFVSYEIIKEKNNEALYMSTPLAYGMSTTTTLDDSTITKYEAVISTSASDIDNSSVTLPFIWHPVRINTKLYNQTIKIADEVKVLLEYIKNNKDAKPQTIQNSTIDIETKITEKVKIDDFNEEKLEEAKQGLNDEGNLIEDQEKIENVNEIKKDIVEEEIILSQPIEPEIIENEKIINTNNQKIEEALKIELDNNKILNDENNLLKQQLEMQQKRVQKLENKLNEKKVEQNKKIKKSISKGVKNIFNIISYAIAIFLYFGAIICLINKEINYSIGYFCFGTPFLPIIYEKLWKNKNVSIPKKVVVRIILFIIAFIIGGIFLSK